MQRLLEKFGLDIDTHFLGSGGECKAFYKGDGLVYKIYAKYNSQDNLERLQSFYDSLDTSAVSFETPKIFDIQEHEEYMLVVEKMMEGICPTSNYLNSISTETVREIIDNYIQVLFQVKNINTDFFQENNPLNTTERFFVHKEYSSWKNLLIENLVHRYVPIRNLFAQSLTNSGAKYNFLLDILQELEYDNSLIHGDLTHENILIDPKSYKITSVIDFGGCTTIGDSIFDLAIGWAFLDRNKRKENLDISGIVLQSIFSKLSKYEQQKFAIYLLTYCFISANMFANNNILEQHFRWCAKNLNNPIWWEMLGLQI